MAGGGGVVEWREAWVSRVRALQEWARADGGSKGHSWQPERLGRASCLRRAAHQLGKPVWGCRAAKVLALPRGHSQQAATPRWSVKLSGTPAAVCNWRTPATSPSAASASNSRPRC